MAQAYPKGFPKRNVDWREMWKDIVWDITPLVVGGTLAMPLPLIRYRGKKLTEARKLAKEMPPVEGKLRELFGGSLALSRELFGAGKAKKIVIGEANPYMLNIYNQLRENPEGVKRIVRELSELHQKSPGQKQYELVKNTIIQLKSDKGMNKLEQAAKDIFVGQYSYAYSPREIPKITAGGNYITPRGLEKRLEETSQMLKKAEIYDDWMKAMKAVGRKDVILADPPYHGTVGRYQEISFPAQESQALSRELEKAGKRGATGVLWSGEPGKKFFPWTEFTKGRGSDWAAPIGNRELWEILRRR